MNNLAKRALVAALVVTMGIVFIPDVYAQTTAALADVIEPILQSSALKGATCGVYIIDAQTGEVLYAKNPDTRFSVASNNKLIVTAASLAILGADFHFETNVYSRGTLADGVLDGDLYVRGSGDPNISGRFHDGDINYIPRQWATKLRAYGITSVTGDIVMDDTLFDRQYVHPDWPRTQRLNWYSAEVSALNFNDNCVAVEIAPGEAPGQPAKVRVHPISSFYTLANECVTTSSKSAHLVNITRPLDSNNITVKGKYWDKNPPRTYDLTIHQPPLFLGTIFKEELKAQGISVKGDVVLADSTPGYARDFTLLLKTRSSLTDTISVMNRNSQNLYAETLFKLLGAKVYGKGSFANGADAMAGFLAKIGIPEGTFSIVDGSGLARDNTFTPRQMVRVLDHVDKSANRDIYLESLPINGVRGNLEDRMDAIPYKGKVYAKTGWIARTAALSGYIMDDNTTYIFSILMNDVATSNRDMKKIQDAICEAVIDNTP